MKDVEEARLYCRAIYDFNIKSYQVKFFYDCMTKTRVIGVFCRQSGKSETTSKIAITKARGKTNSKGRKFSGAYNVLVFAPTDRQTGLLADKIRMSIKKMPYLTYFYLVKETQREFTFSNGAKIICETTGDKGETIRGYTAHCIILEEAGSMKDCIVQEVILPMGSTTDADVIKIGTPRGKNHFFESSRDPSYAVHQYDYNYPIVEGLITKEYIEEMRRMTPDLTFRTEYGAEFIEDQDAYFGYDLIESCVYSVPTSPQNIIKYYLGCDIARLGQDSTCLIVIGIDDKKVAHIIEIVEINKQRLDYTIDKIEELMNKYKVTRTFIDETGLGAGVSDMLSKKFNIPKLQQGAVINKFPHNYQYGDKIVGVKFTIQSKLDMFSNLKVIMQQGRIKFDRNPKLIAQLRDFRYELTENMNVKLHHSEYGHDDFVDALALACKEVNIANIGFAL